jgi:hypothetical protein
VDYIPVDEPVETDVSVDGKTEGAAPSTIALVQRVLKDIKEDKAFHEKAFKQMRRDMFIARNGRIPEYPKEHYKANLAGRHVKQKTASLYAKNPKAVARRRETLDFVVWDENPQSLQLAMQTLQTAQQMMAQAPQSIDPVTGQPGLAVQPPPEMLQAFQKAQEVVADFQQGMERRTQINKIGKTLEILFAQAMREQKPVDFKTGMKKLVRRACTTGVGYLKLAFQREVGPRPITIEKLADFNDRLAHMRVLVEKTADTENPILPDDPEIAELEASVASLQTEPEVILREGLIMDFPLSTRVIPDKMTQSLVGFIGSRRLSLEYLYSPDQIREIFGKDIGKDYQGYKNDTSFDKKKNPATSGISDIVEDDDSATAKPIGTGEGLVCVWEHYDKASGLVYYVADGYSDFLREPAAPDVFVEDFWPVYALTFNDVESESELFPPSDVHLMVDQQQEYNRSRQGMREHRQAARPRWAHDNGSLEKEDAIALAGAEPFTSTGLNLGPGQKIGDVLNVVPVPGVDPNLYETGQLFTDVQLVVGSSEATFGGTAKATATESAIAANSSANSDQSSVDDLDAFLTVVSRSSGQILLREMSEEQVKAVAGPGALWPHLTLEEIADELFLEVEAGSSGKPNQAVELDNWQKILPFILQMPGINPTWVARETLRRLDDKADLTEALTEGLPSIMAQNGMAQVTASGPESDPNAQGAAGADNAPRDDGAQSGSEPAFGSNQVP